MPDPRVIDVPVRLSPLAFYKPGHFGWGDTAFLALVFAVVIFA